MAKKRVGYYFCKDKVALFPYKPICKKGRSVFACKDCMSEAVGGRFGTDFRRYSLTYALNEGFNI